MSADLQPVVDFEAPVPRASTPACPNRECARFGMPAGYIDDGTSAPVGGPCPACSASTDQVPATVWRLPDWAAQVDEYERDDAITYQSRVGEVPTLDDPPITVEVVGADCFDLTDRSVAVIRQPSAVRVAEVQLSPMMARKLAALLTSAATLIEGIR